ncbi:hypothetical protein OG302_43035 [Streptomyces sp. NBC_01283]|uniref:hypothetical protein n=1 Tax=Streptomyces sp. NBC_01283 TaxID=2903812 RepID=UPI00352FD89C|nr:hypothetical protein OG302_43035 [Streptomyces sp. NBC_01283]
MNTDTQSAMSDNRYFRTSCYRQVGTTNLIPALESMTRGNVSAWKLMDVSNAAYYTRAPFFGSSFSFSKNIASYNAAKDPLSPDIDRLLREVPITIRHYTNGDKPSGPPSFAWVLSNWDLTVNRARENLPPIGVTNSNCWCYFGNQHFVFSTIAVHDQPTYRSALSIKSKWYTVIPASNIVDCWCSPDFYLHFVPQKPRTADQANDLISQKWATTDLAGRVTPPLLRASGTNARRAIISAVLTDYKVKYGGSYLTKAISDGNSLIQGESNSAGKVLAVNISKHFSGKLEIKIPVPWPVGRAGNGWLPNPKMQF